MLRPVEVAVSVVLPPEMTSVRLAAAVTVGVVALTVTSAVSAESLTRTVSFPPA